MPDKFNFSSEIRVRLPETDAVGIVFHGNFFIYMDVGRADYLMNLGLMEGPKPVKDFDSVVVKANCEFKSPARHNDVLVVHTRIAEIGFSSVRFEFLISHKRENRLVAKGDVIICAIDEKTWRPIRVPDSFRNAIRNFEKENLIERLET